MTQEVLPTDIAFELTIDDLLFSRVKKMFLNIFQYAAKYSIVSDIRATSKTVLRTGVIIIFQNACILLISVLSISHSH